jgi:inosine kinase
LRIVRNSGLIPFWERSLRFPGSRNPKHYFPVTKKATRVDTSRAIPWYLVGLDEMLVDVEVMGSPELGRELGLVPGESVQLTDEQCRAFLARLEAEGTPRVYAAGGTVANTLNNYTHLSGEPALLLGAMQSSVSPGEPAFAYVAQTPKAVSLSYVRPVDGPTGTAITFISSDGERAFGVAPGVSAQFPANAVPEDVVASAAVVLTSLYALRKPEWPIAGAAMRLMSLARDSEVPVAFGLGTAGLVREKRDHVRALLREYVTVAAMNAQEAEALTGNDDVLLNAEMILDWVDVVVITEGPRGLTLAGWTDESVKRRTQEMIRSKSIPEYNRWEYSRLVRRRDCVKPLKVYSHIHPYRGGPDRLSNTSGAGDAALAALLHDIAANEYHHKLLPHSEKHAAPVRFLTYSSLSRNAQYGNRVAYEVLRGHSPRLDGPVGHDDGAVPERDDRQQELF